MKIGLITYAVDLAALAKKPPPGGVPLHPHCLGKRDFGTVSLTDQRVMGRWARYRTAL
jgi:hypothetical protein